MGVPRSEVGYTAAMPRREDNEVHKGMWWGHWTKENIVTYFCPLRSGTIALQHIHRKHMRLYRLGTFNGNEEMEVAVRDLSGNAKATCVPQEHFQTQAHVPQGTAVAQWLRCGRSLVRSQLVSVDFSLT